MKNKINEILLTRAIWIKIYKILKTKMCLVGCSGGGGYFKKYSVFDWS